MSNENILDQEQYFQAVKQGIEDAFLKAIEKPPALKGAIFEVISGGIHSSFWGYLDSEQYSRKHIDEVLSVTFTKWLNNHKKEIIESIRIQDNSSKKGKRL